MEKPLIVVEHEEIRVSDKRDISKKIISKKDKEELFSIIHTDRFNKERYVFSRKGRDAIKANSIVGSISLKSGLIIEILPKFAKNNLTDETIIQYRKTLLRMIQVSNEKNFISSTLQSSKISVGEMPLIRYMIELFSESLLLSLRNGMVTTYNKRVENSSYIKGNVLLTKTIQNNFIDKSKVYISYNKHSLNNLLMQVFKTLAQLLLNDTNLSYRAKQYLYEAYTLLDNVKIIPLKQYHFDKVIFNRLNEKYETLFRQAEFIFNQYMPFTSNINSTPFWAILFDMNHLFEKFCAFLFRKSDIDIEEQSIVNCFQSSNKMISAKPDFIIKSQVDLFNTKNIIVVDAKWKLLRKKLYGLNAQDFWQLFSYMNLINNNEEVHGYFIVPKNSDEFDDEIVFEPIIEGNKSITILSIDFSLDFEKLIERYKFKIVGNELKLNIIDTKKEIIQQEKEPLYDDIKEEKAETVLEDIVPIVIEESGFNFKQFIDELMLLDTLGEKRNKIHHHNKEDKRFKNLFYLKKQQNINKGAFNSLKDINKNINMISWHFKNINIEIIPKNITLLKNLKSLRLESKKLILDDVLLELDNLKILLIDKDIIEKNLQIIKKLRDNQVYINDLKDNNLSEYINSLIHFIEIEKRNITTKNYIDRRKEEKTSFIKNSNFSSVPLELIEMIMEETDIDLLEDFTYNQTLPLRFAFATYNNNLDRKESEVARLRENLIKRDIKVLKWIAEWTIDAQENYIRENISNINREVLLGYAMSTLPIFQNIRNNITTFNSELEELSKKKKEANSEEYYELALESFKNKDFEDALEYLKDYEVSSSKKEDLKSNIYKEIGQPFNSLKEELLGIKQQFDIENRADIKKYLKDLQLKDYPILNFLTKKLSTQEINHLTFILTYLNSLDKIDNKFIKTIKQFFEIITDNLVDISEAENKVLNSNILAWKDLETGLIWEIKNDYNINQVLSWKKCFDYAKKLNSNNYANCNDWRVPTIEELKTLHIAIMTNNFYIKKPLSNNITKDIYWSSTEYKVDRKHDAYIINFKYSKDHKLQAYITHSRSIRCVRGK
jgi:5-methylcytosine-specific restriction endonuclease McrBC regulatory subunit McrC